MQSISLDDEPDEEGSPQHYVLIHGFLSASTLQHLANIGVHVNALIKLQQDEYRTVPPPTEECHEDVEDEVLNKRTENIYKTYC
jgi:hypothetical protein